MPEMLKDYSTHFINSFNASEIDLSADGPKENKHFLVEAAYAVAEHTGNFRQELLSEIPSNMEGIDEASIKDFFESTGMRVSDYLVFDPSETAHYSSIAKEHGWSGFPEPTDQSKHFGLTLPGINMAVVQRDPDMEERYGTIFTEAVLVHELAHASSTWNEWSAVRRDDNRSLTARRVGFKVLKNTIMDTTIEDRHNYLEEGFVSMIAAEYLKFKGTSLDYKSYADEAGLGVAALADQIPGLREALVSSRSGLEGLRKVSTLVNSVEPNLYASLSKLPYTKEAFILGTEKIQDALAKNNKELV